MMEGIGVFRCKSCGRVYFPQRLLCPHCHGAEFTGDRVYEGVVREVSTIRHMIGQTDWQPRRIANVETRDGPLLTVGLRDDAKPGDVIALFQDDGAPYGERKRG